MTSPDNSVVPGAPVESPAPLPASSGTRSRIRNYFLTGLVLVGPLYVTVGLTWWFINWVDELARPITPDLLRTETYLSFHVPGFGLIIAFCMLTLLGFLTANLIGRKLVGYGEYLLHRMPIVRPIYKTMKQIFESLFSKSGSSFRKVALVQFPAPGMWSLVFVSQAPGRDITSRLPQTEHVSVFMPCTPNPTTGFFFYVPRRDLIELDITVEAAMALLISAGMVQPDGDGQQQLATLAQTARAARSVREAAAPAKSPVTQP
jgi:uncharacterized membrane protein